MSRLVFPLVAVLALPAVADAQISPAPGPISPVMPPISPVQNFRGRPFPFPPVFPWYPGWYGYGGYGYQEPQVVVVPVPFQSGPPAAPERVVIPGNEFPATLVLEFPAAAELWVNGQKSEHEPTSEWTLTSPVLKQGEDYTFQVKARWKSGGKTFEAERTVTVPNGKRSRAIVVSGTEIKG